ETKVVIESEGLTLDPYCTTEPPTRTDQMDCRIRRLLISDKQLREVPLDGGATLGPSSEEVSLMIEQADEAQLDSFQTREAEHGRARAILESFAYIKPFG